MVSPFFESTFPPRWKSCSKVGETCSTLGPGGAWLETGLTDLSSFEGVSLFATCKIGESIKSQCLFVRTPMIVLVLSETVKRSRSGLLTPVECERYSWHNCRRVISSHDDNFIS
jgi:hypothetical protein